MKIEKCILDTNLFILLLIGLYNPDAIKVNKRTSKYSIEDFESLRSFLLTVKKIFITPHILTEVSNLTDRIGGKDVYNYFEIFKSVAKSHFEIYTPKDKLLDSQLLPRIGITDTSLYFAAKETNSIIITDDEECAPYLESHDCEILCLSAIQEYMKS
ncbi:MAG: hypothetical protein A2014_01345 [Spirochaetes bacterium GWF1_49_6]|nr:MAG: hypothetical protein A2014_01345 [Spirochaetes bacterium GWF1_49_6]